VSDSGTGPGRPRALAEVASTLGSEPRMGKSQGAGRGRVALLAAILIAVTGTATLAALAILYRVSVNQTRDRLREYVQSQARLIEQIVAHEQRFGPLVPDSSGHGTPRQAVLTQVADAHALFAGAGRTGEFRLAERVGDSIAYLVRHRSHYESLPMSIPFLGRTGTPMKRALSGQSGTMIGPDYRGISVVAAYEPLRGYGWGAVAKIDLSEVRAPFVRAGLLVALISLLLASAGIWLFLRVTNPVLAMLAASESRFRLVVENLPLGIHMYRREPDGTMRFIRANPAADRILKVDNAQYVGKTMEEAFPGTVGTETPERFRDIAHRGGFWHNEQLTYADEGIAGALEFRAFQTEPDVMASLFDDITARRRAEEEIRFFSTVFENSIEGVYLIRVADGVIVRTNARFDAMFGYARGELVGKNVSVVNAPGDVSAEETAKAIIAELNRTGTWRGEVRNVKKDRTQFWCEAMVSTYRHPVYGEVWLSVHRDITERKWAEEERERLNRELAARSVDLEELIRAASHDLRTPLVGVKGFVGELRRVLEDVAAELSRPAPSRERVAPLVETDIPRALKFIEAGTARMDALLAGMLRLSRLGSAVPHVAELDANRIVDDVLRTVEYAANEAGARIEHTPLPPCRGDATMVAGVFTNLIENALKYRDPERPLVVQVTGRRDRNVATYCVEDNGIGIPEDGREHLFEPFYQVEPRTSKGEGLGLTIVKRTVERLGGKVWLESEEGKGSKFYFSLPAVRR